MFKATLDTKNFDKALSEYMKFTKRSISEVIDAKLNYIGRNATFTTGAASKTKIQSELMAPSRVNPNAPLAAILVNKKLKDKGQKGLHDSAMTTAIEKLIRTRNRSINFLRSGWLPGIKILESAMRKGDSASRSFSSRFAPKINRQVKQVGKAKGSAIPARPNQERTFGEIENSVRGGKTESGPAKAKLIQGLQEAVQREVNSMNTYIDKKYAQAIAKFNK